jgi:hypothetical protein
MGLLIHRSSFKHYSITNSMSWSGIMLTTQKRHKKLINHWYLRSLTGIQLIQLHTVGNSFSGDYRLCDILNSFPSEVVSFMDFLAQYMGTLFLLNQSIPKMTSMTFESKTIRLATKSTPHILRFNLRHIVFHIYSRVANFHLKTTLVSLVSSGLHGRLIF